MNSQSKEILKWSPDEKITIKSFEDFKRRINISELPEWELKEFFIKPLETTQGELDELRKSYIKWEPNLSTVKDFLETSRLSIIEETKQSTQEVKKIAWDLKESIRFEHIKNKQWEIDWKNADSQIDNALESISDSTENLSWEIKDKTKASVEKAKVVAQKVKESWYTVQLWEAMNDAFTKLKKFDIWWALVSLFKWLFGMFTWGEVLKKAWDKVKEVLDPTTPEYKETLNQTQDTIISYIEKTTWEKLDEKTKTRLKTKLSPNIQWSYINTEDFKELTKKIKSWKKLGIEDLKNSWVILNIIRDPDFKEIKELLSSNINKKLFNFFKSKFEKSWVTFNEENEWKLKSIIKKEFETTTFNELVERTKENWWEVHFDWLEWVESILWVWVLIPNIIFEAYKEDIIKAENLAIWVVESWKDTISIWLKALDWKDIIPDLIWRMNWDDFDEKLLNVTPEKKLLLERAFYAELWLVSSVLGTIWFYWTSSLVSLIEWWANKLEWKWFKTPNVNRLEKTLNIIWEWKWAWLKEIEEAINESKKSYEIVEKLKNPNIDKVTKETLRKELSEISWKFENKAWSFYSKETLSKITKNMNPLQTFHYKKSLEQLQQIAKTNQQLWIAIIEWSFTKKALEVKQFIESFKLRYINWHAVLNITDWLKAKEFTKAMWSLAPEMIRWLFRVAPILIVWWTIWDSTKQQDWEWYKTLLMLNGFTWWIQLFKDTEVSYTEEWLKITNPESFAWWMALVWMETFFFWKEFLQYVSKWQYIRALPMATFNSFVRLPLDAVKWIWWASVRSYEALKIARSFLEKSPKKWKIWLWIALLLWAVISVEYASADEIDSAQLEKDWLIKDWKPNIELLKNKWNKIEDNKKEEIISLYSLSILEKPFNWKGDKFNFNLEDWLFKIKIDKNLESEKELVEKLLIDVSRFLTDINSNIKLDIQFS